MHDLFTRHGTLLMKACSALYTYLPGRPIQLAFELARCAKCCGGLGVSRKSMLKFNIEAAGGLGAPRSPEPWQCVPCVCGLV
jgi:hypothetical protein